MKRNKYGNSRCEYQGIKFASVLELDRYIFLKDCESKGRVRDIKIQPRFPLFVRNTRVCEYIADYQYYVGSKMVIEDCKGYILTDIFRLKRKMFNVEYGMDIHIVTKKNLTVLP